MKPLLLWGSGGLAREVLWLCRMANLEAIGFLDERPEMRGTNVHGVPIIGDLADAGRWRFDTYIVVASVGDPLLKRRLNLKTTSMGFKLAPAVVSPLAAISSSVSLGEGSVVCTGVVMTVDIRVGKGVCVNLNTTVGHDCIIDDYVTISPGVNISGNVSIGQGAYIGTGSAIRERLTVGEWSIVAGGAFVARPVDAYSLVAGVPARFQKNIHVDGF